MVGTGGCLGGAPIAGHCSGWPACRPDLREAIAAGREQAMTIAEPAPKGIRPQGGDLVPTMPGCVCPKEKDIGTYLALR